MPYSGRNNLWYALLGAFLAVAAVSCVALGRRAIANMDWVVHTEKAREDAGAVLEAAQDEEIGARGYLITAKPEYLAPYEDGSRRLLATVENFRRRTADNPRQQMLAGRLEEEVRILDSALSRAVTEAKADPEMVRPTFHALGTRNRLDAIRRLINHARAEEDRLLALRQESAKRDFGWISNIGYLSSLVMGLACLIRLASLREPGR